MIKIENLTFNYKDESKNIFENAELNINSGIWLLEGDNGTGKSTLFKILNNTYSDYGIVSDDTSVKVEGEVLFLEDKISLPANLEEGDIAKYIFKINDITLNEEYTPLYKNKPLCMYSVGERKMATLKIISYLNIDILIADEYIANIDESNLIDVFKILNKLKDNGTIIIISSNEADIKNRFSNKIIINEKKLEVVRVE